MRSLPLTPKEWTERAKRIHRRDVIDAVLIAIVVGIIAICGGR